MPVTYFARALDKNILGKDSEIWRGWADFGETYVVYFKWNLIDRGVSHTLSSRAQMRKIKGDVIQAGEAIQMDGVGP